MRNLLITDADNTLWDTDAVFAKAQVNLLSGVEALTGPLSSDENKLSFVRKFDQKIARSHSDGLRYPAAILIEALIVALSGVNQVNDSDIHKLQVKYYSDLRQRPRLRWGVRPALQELSEHDFAIWVVSEASEKRVNQSLGEHGIDLMVERVVSEIKNLELFTCLFKEARRFGFKAVVGDQLDRDIVPAKRAGFFTIHLPGSFAPDWVDLTEARFADIAVGNYRDIAESILARGQLQNIANAG